MTDRATFFEAVLLRVHARMRLRPPYPLSARDVDAWLARREPALLAEAERETTRWIAILNRLAELGETLISADLRRLAHACYSWAYALDPTLADDSTAQQQVRANLALSGMWHPTLAAQLHPDRLDDFVARLVQELAVAERGGASLRRVQPVLRKLAELAGLPASKSRLPKVAHAELLVVLTPLVWAFHLPRLELIGPITAFRLHLLGLPDSEIMPWLTEAGGPWWWIWTGDLSALTGWLRREIVHFRPLHAEVEAALEQLDSMVVPRDPAQLTARLIDALQDLHTALQATSLTRESALVLAFLAALQGEPAEADAHAQRAGLLPGPDTAWLRTHHLPELLTRISFARHHRGPAAALRAVEQLALRSHP